MSLPIDRTTDHNTVDVIKTSQSSSAGVLNVVPLCNNHSKIMSFADNENVVVVAQIKGIERKLSFYKMIQSLIVPKKRKKKKTMLLHFGIIWRQTMCSLCWRRISQEFRHFARSNGLRRVNVISGG